MVRVTCIYLMQRYAHYSRRQVKQKFSWSAENGAQHFSAAEDVGSYEAEMKKKTNNRKII